MVRVVAVVVIEALVDVLEDLEVGVLVHVVGMNLALAIMTALVTTVAWDLYPSAWECRGTRSEAWACEKWRIDMMERLRR